MNLRKRSSVLAAVSVAAAAAIITHTAASAQQTFYWDTDDTAGIQGGGTATWSTSDINWNSASNGSTLPRVVWTDNTGSVTVNHAVFNAPSIVDVAPGAYVHVKSLTFNADTTINAEDAGPGTLTGFGRLALGGGFYVPNSGTDANLTGGTVTVAGGVTATIGKLYSRDFSLPNDAFDGRLIKEGSGTLIVLSCNYGSATGDTWVKAGTLKAGAATTDSVYPGSSSPTSPISWGSHFLRVDSGGTFDCNGFSQHTWQNTSSSGSQGTITNSGPTLVSMYDMRYTGGDFETSDYDSPTARNRIRYTGNLNYVKKGSSPVYLYGQSDYKGQTDLDWGTIFLRGGNDRLPTHTELVINQIGRGDGSNTSKVYFTVEDRNQEIAGLSHRYGWGLGFATQRAGYVTNGLGDVSPAPVLTLNGQVWADNNSDGVYDDLVDKDFVFAGGIKGKISIVKNGNNTQVLSGSASVGLGTENNGITYSGSTTINGGVLELQSAHTGGNAVTVNADGTFAGKGNESADVRLAGGRVNPGSITDLSSITGYTTHGSAANPGLDPNYSYDQTSTFTLGGLITNYLGSSGSTLAFDLGAVGGDNDLIVIDRATDDEVLSFGGGSFEINPLGGFGAGTYTLIDYAPTAAIGGLLSSMTVNGPGGFTYSLQDNPTTTAIELLVAVGGGKQWAGPGSGLWSNAGQWSPSGTPISSDDITLGNMIAADSTITIDSGGVVSSTTVNSTHKYTIALSGPTTFDAGDLDVQAGELELAAGGSNTLRASSLTIAASGAKLDLTNNSMVLDYEGASPSDTIRQKLQSAYAAGAWTGDGITSANAQTAATTDDKTAIGFAESTDGVDLSGFAGLDGTTLVAKYTLVGDANLDEKVNTLDFNLLAGNFGGVSQIRWSKGDFDYDGDVDSVDFGKYLANYGKVLPAPSPVLGAAVPEPAGIAALIVGLPLAVRRRRA